MNYLILVSLEPETTDYVGDTKVTNKIFIPYNGYYVPITILREKLNIDRRTISSLLDGYYSENLQRYIKDIKLMYTSRDALIHALLDANILLFDPSRREFLENFDESLESELKRMEFEPKDTLSKIRTLILKYFLLKSTTWEKYNIDGINYRKNKDMVIKGDKVLFAGIDFPHYLLDTIKKELPEKFTYEEFSRFCMYKIFDDANRYLKIHATSKDVYELFDIDYYYAIDREIICVMLKFTDRLRGIYATKTVFNPIFKISKVSDNEEIEQILKVFNHTTIQSDEFAYFSKLGIAGILDNINNIMYIIKGLEIIPIKITKQQRIGNVLNLETNYGTVTLYIDTIY